MELAILRRSSNTELRHHKRKKVLDTIIAIMQKEAWTDWLYVSQLKMERIKMQILQFEDGFDVIHTLNSLQMTLKTKVSIVNLWVNSLLTLMIRMKVF